MGLPTVAPEGERDAWRAPPDEGITDGGGDIAKTSRPGSPACTGEAATIGENPEATCPEPTPEGEVDTVREEVATGEEVSESS